MSYFQQTKTKFSTNKNQIFNKQKKSIRLVYYEELEPSQPTYLFLVVIDDVIASTVGSSIVSAEKN